jgi:ATP/maltotriose-dependent transcriptional regulator MalT
LKDAQAGQPATVVVVGEPGIGKSRLLSELRERAGSLDFEVLAGRGFEPERHVPFGLIVDALDEPLSAFAPTIRRRLGDERFWDLAATLPSLASEAPREPAGTGVARVVGPQTLRIALEEVTSKRPVLLVLDDVHWAGPGSFELLSYLLRHGVPGMLLAIAYRPELAQRELAGSVALAATAGTVHSIELPALTKAEAAALVGSELIPAHFERMYGDSGGNPFYLTQLARVARDGDGHPISDAGPGGRSPVPPEVKDAIAHELDGLSATARQLLLAAAVTGDPFDLDLAVAVAEVHEPMAYAALDELLVLDLVRETDVPGQVRFRHPIVRQAIYEAAGSGWVLGAHRRAAQALAVRGATTEARVPHVERAAPIGDEQAIALLIEAGQNAAVLAPAAAARWFRAALRLLPENADRGRRIALLLPLATALGTIGRFHESLTTLHQVLKLLPSAETTIRAQVISLIARGEASVGRGHEARELLDQALAQTEPGSREAVVIMLASARNHLMLHDWEHAADTGTLARGIAATLGDPVLLLYATATNALLEGFRSEGGSAAGLELTDLAAAGIDALPDADFGTWGLPALVSLAYSEASHDRWRDVERHVERGLRISQETGHGALYVELTHMRCLSRLLQGRLAEALQFADEAVDMARRLGNDQVLAAVEGTRCWATSLQGRTREALSSGKRAVEAVARVPHSLLAWHARTSYGGALVDAGQPELGRSEIMAAGGTALTDVPPPVRPIWYRTLTEIEVAAGDVEAADTMARRAETVAAALNLDGRTGHARYARALVYLARGEAERAASFARVAVACYEASGEVVEAGRAGVLEGRALAQAGQIDEAERQLKLALASCERYGAGRLADRAASELRRLGRPATRTRRRQRPAEQGVDALTRREREVADLVAEGYSNREIAARLYLSPKTIETHLSQVYAKLGVSSRLAAAAKLGGSGAVRT